MWILLCCEVFIVLLTNFCPKERTKFTKIVMCLMFFCDSYVVVGEKFIKLAIRIFRVSSAWYTTYIGT